MCHNNDFELVYLGEQRRTSALLIGKVLKSPHSAWCVCTIRETALFGGHQSDMEGVFYSFKGGNYASQVVTLLGITSPFCPTLLETVNKVTRSQHGDSCKKIFQVGRFIRI